MTTYKILLMMRRKPGMSVEAFREYYENHHAPLASRHAAGLIRYVRRYLDHHPHPETGGPDETLFDVITELWFADEAIFKGALNHLTTHSMPADIIEDEMKLFDRTSFRISTTVEYETDMATRKDGD